MICAQRLLRPKLSVNQPDDEYEREADRVAEHVTGMSEPLLHQQNWDEDEELVQPKPVADQITMLAQRQEEEEEVYPESFTGQTSPTVQRQEEEELFHLKPSSGQTGPVVQAQVEEEEEEPVQTKGESTDRGEVTADLEARINGIRHGGQPLPESVRDYFEPRFGYDLGHVRVHRDSDAAGVARDINARSFTIGRDIAFADGEYDPSSSGGRKLMAHELTHVIQQDGVNRRAGRDDAISRDSSRASLPTGERSQRVVEGDADISGLDAGSVQKVPADAAVLITELNRYGRQEVLQGLVDAEKSAIDRFHDELKNRADRATDFWSMVAGGAGTVAGAAAPGAVGVGSAAAAPYVLVGGLIAAAGVLLVGQWTKSGIERFLHQSRTRCREEADEHGRRYEPTVTALANSFGRRVAAGQEADLTADTEQYARIEEVFRTRILEAPSTNRVYDLKWNRLCDSWNHYLRGSTHWHAYPESAGALLMTRRPVRD
jgi:hypothetical protein